VSQISYFEKYISKVFKINEVLLNLNDLRDNPDIDIQNIFLGYLYGSAFRIKATSAIEAETREGVLIKRVGGISDDTIGYGLDRLTIRSTRNSWNMLSKISKRNGMLRENPFHDYIVGIFDGIEIYKSYKSECSGCLTRKIETKKGEKIQYYHRAVVLTLAGYDFPIPIGLDMMKKGEDEVSCALRLLKRVVNDLGVRFLDIVIGDALYCIPRFFDECEKLGIYPGAVLKDNQEDLVETAESMKRKTDPVITKEYDDEKLKLCDFQDVIWDTGDRDVRVIWADREVLEIDEESQDRSLHWVDKRRVFAFSKKIDHLPASVVYNIGVHRWDIDAKIFMDMVKHWHLKHKTLHYERAYENMLSIRFMAYMLFMFFFFRHINSRRKKKIEGYINMSRILYRSACVDLEPKFILLD
jgi:hypothetical protein